MTIVQKTSQGLLLASSLIWCFASQSLAGGACDDFPAFEDLRSFGEFQSIGPLHGVAIFDYNNDGLEDVFVGSGAGFPHGLFENQGDNNFVFATFQAGIFDQSDINGVLAADLDNDGWTDLFLTHTVALPPTQGRTITILKNQGGVFVDVSDASPVQPISSMMSCASDIDHDGDLDVFVAVPNYLIADAGPVFSHLLRNDGNMGFTDVTNEVGLGGIEFACVSSFHDYDNAAMTTCLWAYATRSTLSLISFRPP